MGGGVVQVTIVSGAVYFIKVVRDMLIAQIDRSIVAYASRCFQNIAN